ncbi:MAG: DUF1778 domain-containing protein [Phycisphaerae bacterium]
MAKKRYILGFRRAEETIVLSDRNRDIFLAMLKSDREPNEALKQAVARYKREKT